MLFQKQKRNTCNVACRVDSQARNSKTKNYPGDTNPPKEKGRVADGFFSRQRRAEPRIVFIIGIVRASAIYCCITIDRTAFRFCIHWNSSTISGVPLLTTTRFRRRATIGNRITFIRQFSALTGCSSDKLQSDTLPQSPAANKVTANTGCCVEPRSDIPLQTVLSFWYASGEIIFIQKKNKAGTESGYTCTSTQVHGSA